MIYEGAELLSVLMLGEDRLENFLTVDFRYRKNFQPY